MGLRGLSQVVVQFLRHILQDQIGHGKLSTAFRFIADSFYVILVARARPLKRTHDWDAIGAIAIGDIQNSY